MPQTEVGVELFEGGLERRKNRLNQRRELINLVNASRCGGDSGTANP
jgi:hypothetical protein